MADLSEILKNIDPKLLQEGIKKTSEFASTEEGKKLIENIKKTNPKDRESVIKMMEQNPQMFKSIEKHFKS